MSKTTWPEWAQKAIKRRVIRLCDRCLKSWRRCYDSTKRGYKPHQTWKEHRGRQWWPR